MIPMPVLTFVLKIMFRIQMLRRVINKSEVIFTQSEEIALQSYHNEVNY